MNSHFDNDAKPHLLDGDVSSQYRISTTCFMALYFTMGYVERLKSVFILSRTRVLLTNAFSGTKLFLDAAKQPTCYF